MAEHLVKIPCHIVFILKLYSKFLLGLFHCPAYLQLAPLPNRECCGLPMVNRYHGTLTPPRNAPSRPRQPGNGSIIIPNFSIMANSRTTRQFSLSVDRSLPVERSWRQKASRFEKRGKIRSTGYSVFKVP